MERLTIPAEKLPGGGTRIPVVDANAVRDHAMEIYWRLKAYEDTGLAPEEVMGLCEMGKRSRMAQMLCWEEAAQEGRLVVLPCKLHESIYYLEDGDWFEDIPYEVGLGQRQGEWEDVLLFLCEGGFSFYGEEVGKTVFLTIAEAEEKLREVQG